MFSQSLFSVPASLMNADGITSAHSYLNSRVTLYSCSYNFVTIYIIESQ